MSIRKNDSTHFVCHFLILKMMTFLLLKHVSTYGIVNEKLINVAPFYFGGKKGVKLQSIMHYEWAPPHKPAVQHMSLNGRGPTLCSLSYLNVSMKSYMVCTLQYQSCQLSQYGQLTHDFMAFVPVPPDINSTT